MRSPRGGLFASEGPGGALVRRLLPVMVCALLVLGYLRWQGEQLGWYGTGTGVLLLTVAAVVVLSGLMIVFARRLDQQHAARRRAEVDARHTGLYFDLARDLLCTATFDGCFKDLNAEWTKVLGWGERELRSRPFIEFVHPDDQQSTAEEAAKLAAGDVTVDFRNRYRTKDGRWRWLEWSARADPDLELIYASARDVSERKLTEQYLMAQHEAVGVLAEASTLEQALPALLRVIGEHMGWPVGAFWVLAGNGSSDVLRCAGFWHAPAVAAGEFEQATKRARLTRGERLPGKVWESRQPLWVPDVGAEADYPRLSAARADGLHACVLLPIVGRSAVVGVIELLSDEVRVAEPALLDVLGTLSGQIGQFVERKRGEVALEASEREMRQILDTAFDAFISIDAEGRILQWNEQAEAMFGWSRGEVAGRDLAETIIPERYHEAHRGGIERFLASGEGPVLKRLLELPGLHRDGHEFPVELTISAVEGEFGNSFHAFLRDISQRRRVQDELAKARDDAHEATKRKSEFLAMISHEIRTPMNGVIGMTGLLLDTDLDRVQREYAETVRGSGEALLEIVNDILDFSKFEAGKLELEVVEFASRELLEEVADLLAGGAHAKGLELAVVIAPEVPARLGGDPGRLRQVVMNLVGNAIKFTERGEVVLRAGVAEETDVDVLLRFEVVDTGTGVGPQQRAALFEPFSQADASTTRTHGGTGLGLAICKQLAEAMGGEIGLESVLGEGSCFWFTARMAKVREGAERRPSTHEDLEDLRVLIVDDNETNRKVLDRQVSSWGMRGETCEGGDRALELLRTAAADGAPYDVVLLDMNMPGMDGIDLARAIGAEAAVPPPPLLLLTSSDGRGVAEEAGQAGISAFLTKPVRQARLFEAIAKVTGAEAEPPGAAARPAISPEGAPSGRQPLLVADDNPVNQQVAVALLRKIGYRADVVANGAEALEALSRTRYGAVLMDIEMPVLDGYGATRELRRREVGARRTPVIAMTAAAMKGDREKCLAAGMDDYITKPVQRAKLEAALGRWVEPEDREQAPGDSADAANGPAPEAGSIDRERLSLLRGLQQPGEADVLSRLIVPFLETAPSQLTALREATVSRDQDAVKRAAHALKGSSSNLGAARMAELCAGLETLANSGEPKGIDEAITELEDEFVRVRAAFEIELQPTPR